MPHWHVLLMVSPVWAGSGLSPCCRFLAACCCGPILSQAGDTRGEAHASPSAGHGGMGAGQVRGECRGDGDSCPLSGCRCGSWHPMLSRCICLLGPGEVGNGPAASCKVDTRERQREAQACGQLGLQLHTCVKIEKASWLFIFCSMHHLKALLQNYRGHMLAKVQNSLHVLYYANENTADIFN